MKNRIPVRTVLVSLALAAPWAPGLVSCSAPAEQELPQVNATPGSSLGQVGRTEAGAPIDPNTQPGGTMPGQTELELPWTDAFLTSTVVVARDIVVEGPPGLLAHTALTSDLTRYTVHQETTEKGFLQRVTARPEVLREVRCHLDAWVLAAENSITVLERPGPCDVVVTATGAAVLNDVNGKQTSDEELVFTGSQP